MKCGKDPTAGNKMFAQWCGDVLLKVLSSFHACLPTGRFGVGDPPPRNASSGQTGRGFESALLNTNAMDYAARRVNHKILETEDAKR